MKRGSGKKSGHSQPTKERRRQPRSRDIRLSKQKTVNPDACSHCGIHLGPRERALFVEEEIGRVFCTEGCISEFFTPEVERLEKEFLRRRQSSDLSGEEREKYSHLRWVTLQEPDEVWREKTLTGDFRHTLITEFHPDRQKKVWSICICLCLRGDPSFLYLAFTTKNSAMVNAYRKGEQIAQSEAAPRPIPPPPAEDPDSKSHLEAEQTDRLGDPWTASETFMAQTNQERREDDIPEEEFPGYQKCLDETLDAPDEVWSSEAEETLKKYHFIKHYPATEERDFSFWYIIIARETEDQEQIELLDAFPTIDMALVDRYRRGEQEVGHVEPQSASRVIH